MKEWLQALFKTKLNRAIAVIVVLAIFMYVYSNLVGDEGAFVMMYIYVAVLLTLAGVKMWQKYKATKDQADLIDQIPMSARDYKEMHNSNMAIVKNYRFMAVVLWMLSFILLSIILPGLFKVL